MVMISMMTTMMMMILMMTTMVMMILHKPFQATYVIFVLCFCIRNDGRFQRSCLRRTAALQNVTELYVVTIDNKQEGPLKKWPNIFGHCIDISL